MKVTSNIIITQCTWLMAAVPWKRGGEQRWGCMGKSREDVWGEEWSHSAQQPTPASREDQHPNPTALRKASTQGKMPWVGQWDKGFLFLAIPRNFSLSGRLGQGALQSHCVLAKCFGNAVSHSEFG